MKKTIYSILFFVFAAIIYINLVAFEDGIVGVTKKNGGDIGCVCHNFKPFTRLSVIISGPSMVEVNDTVTYTLRVANGPDVAAGCDIATSLGEVYTSPLDTSLRRAEQFPGAKFELTHRYPKLFTGDTLEFTFTYIAPSTPDVIDTIFANSNSVNHDTTSENDEWNYANNFLINIIKDPLPVEISSFTSLVNENKVNLNWSTVSETNNSGFQMERFSVNHVWENIGFIKGNGTTPSGSSYSFTDKNLISGKYSYRLKQVDFNGNFEYFNLNNEVVVGIPDKFELSQNYPNPFNPSTKIDFRLPADGNVKINVYDNSGKAIMSLMNEFRSAGYYTVNLNAASLSSGAYFYRITSQDFSAVRKMIVLK